MITVWRLGIQRCALAGGSLREVNPLEIGELSDHAPLRAVFSTVKPPAGVGADEEEPLEVMRTTATPPTKVAVTPMTKAIRWSLIVF
jgi:hypothetical protein